jgi:peroxiredoxin
MHGWLIAALVVAWVLAALLASALILLLQQHGRLILQLDELQARLSRSASGKERRPEEPIAGLEVGAPAPPFELPGLDGVVHRLDDYLGAEVLLVFFNPGCIDCARLSEELGRLEGGPRVVMVTQGDPDDNRRLADSFGWQFDVLHEDDWKVVEAYRTHATPSAYLVDAEGRIASPLTLAADEILVLAGRQSPPGDNGRRSRGLAVRDVAESRLVRDGLKAGTAAPTFVLPDVDGRTRSLVDFRGKRVLLVFSDAGCGPCEALAPDLVELHARSRDDLNVVMVSRGDPEVNRAKARMHGYKFPVLLQRSWEVSKQYGLFETPAGYLIDRDGVIARDAAVGREAILDLVR